MSIVLLFVKALAMIAVGFAAVLGAAAYLSGAPGSEGAGLCEATMLQACIFTIL